MSANIDTMLYVGETPWHGLGTKYEVAPKSSEAIIKGAQLDWTVEAAPMYTDLHGPITGYHAIYREDNNEVLGVVNNRYPNMVQNADTFNAFDNLLGKSLDVETAASLGRGETVFGCFKIQNKFKVMDDDIDHYFVVMNDHLKVDGKVTVMNTPVRVVCQNTLSAALSNNLYKLRIPVSADSGVNAAVTEKLFTSIENAMRSMQKSAETMCKQKLTREHLDKILDELFPYIQVEGESTYSAANANTEIMRDTFITQCMGADNLANYRGTAYQVFNALTDYTQHYFKKLDKAYDLNYRMKLLPGMGVDSEATKVTKFLRMKDKLIA